MSQTFACRLTAPLPSAIATIAIRGPQSLEVISKCLNKSLAEHHWAIGRIRFLKWPIQNENEHVVACRVDERTLEIHCHGGVAISNSILAALREKGCVLVDQAEWTQLDQPTDNRTFERFLQQSCEQELLLATSERTAGILLDQAHGALYKLFLEIQELVRDKRWLDASILIDRVSKWNSLGLHLVEPWRVVLAGPPNVGKSSLINALSGQALAIVHPEAGTTRDWIEAQAQIDGWPVSLTDTAGIRQTDEVIEAEGVQRATERIASADLVIIVVDSSIGWTAQHDHITALCEIQESNPRILVAWNKSDLPGVPLAGDPSNSQKYPHFGKAVRCSATGDISELLAAISRELVPEQPMVGQPIVFNQSQQELLQKIRTCLLSQISPASESELNLWIQELTRIPLPLP